MVTNKFIITPQDRTCINNKLPNISLLILDKDYLKDAISLKMYLDSKKITPKVALNIISYIPDKSLSRGKHKVKFIIKFLDGSKKTISWSFKINSSNCKSSPLDKYNFYYGIPHAHTSLSTGKGIPIDAFNYAYKNKLDFLIITDHSRYLNKRISFNSSDIKKWDLIKRSSMSFSKNHTDFLALSGFEVTSSDYGDFNVINTNNLYSEKIKNFSKFTNWLEQSGNPIVFINHPHKYIENFNYSLRLDKFINFIEVGNGCFPTKYLNGEKYYYKLLDNGWHIGAINGQDNHKLNWGDSDNLTVVISKSLKSKDFFEALNNRRTYSTETKSLKLIFTINDCWMGSKIASNDNSKLNFRIYAEDKKVPIKKVQLLSRGGIVIQEKTSHKKSKIKWDFSLTFKKNSWYVVRIIHEDGRCGVSSAIFT
ncbi:CehA/McbA family metallohydrolase [Clostridium sp. JNZ J1-5]